MPLSTIKKHISRNSSRGRADTCRQTDGYDEVNRRSWRHNEHTWELQCME